MKITILDDVYLNYNKEQLSKFGEVKYYTRYEKEFLNSDEELIKRIGDSEVIVTCHVSLNKNVINACTNLKYIIAASTGVNHIDINAAKSKGILISNIPTYGTMSVAQATVALLLEVVNRVSSYDKIVRDDTWESGPDWCVVNEDLIELDKKQVGIIGYGAIGKEVAKMFEAFGMNVITYDVSDGEDRLNYLLENSQVISLHCPLTKESKHMINSQAIAKMKDGVILLNTSRGSLVNSDDLYDALKSHKIYFAAFDVVDNEPIGKDHKLLELNNFIITPHIAWATIEARNRIVDLVYKNLEGYVNNEPINLIK